MVSIFGDLWFVSNDFLSRHYHVKNNIDLTIILETMDIP